MTTKTTADNFLNAVRKSELIAPDQLTRLLEDFRQRGVRFQDAATLADELVAAEALTRWQADKLLEGKHSGFFLGKYRLLSLLGKGGMSSVYLAEHVLMRRRCAIKVLPTRRVNDSSYLGRFHREAQAVASLDHSNIVRAYDVDQETQRNKQIHFLVMEYVEGESLLDMVQKRGPLDFVSAADYTRQSAEGLAHAHASGMVHRDVKPGNLLVDGGGTVKILDLGLARFFRNKEDKSLTVAHDEKVLGTADYLAPEQARDSHGVDHRADIYSLGCTFYFLLTGHPPFSEGTLAQRLLAHQVLDPPSITIDRPETPPELLRIVEQMMAKNPEERFQDAQEVADALADWLFDHGGEDWRRRNPGLSGSGTGGSGARRAVDSGTAIQQRSHSDGGAAITRRGSEMDTVALSVSHDARQALAAASAAAPGIARPQNTRAEYAAAPSGDDSALAMFLTKLTDVPPEGSGAERGKEPRPETTAPAPGEPVAAPEKAYPGPAAPGGPAPESQKHHPPPAVAAIAVPVALPVQQPGGPASARRSAPDPDHDPQGTLLEMPAVPVDAVVEAGSHPAADPLPAAKPAPRVMPVAAAAPAPAHGSVGQPPKSRRIRPAMIAGMGLALLVVLGGAILALVTGPSDDERRQENSDASAVARQQPPADAATDPRKLLGKDIHVGPAGAFKTINEAVAYVREHFRPKSRRDRQVIRVAGGLTYSERLDLGHSDGSRPFPRRVSIICGDPNRAILEPVGADPVLKLDGIKELTVSGFVIRGPRATAIELAGFLDGTQLRDLELSGFGQVGVLGRNAQGALSVGSRRNELVLERIAFHGGANAVGLRLEGESGRIHVSGCRFFQPLDTGIEIARIARYVELRDSVFANVETGVRFAGSAMLKSVTLAHNTFYGVKQGVVFAEMPQDSSADLAFYRNLFDKVGMAEVLVESGMDQRRFERALAAGGPEQNWTTRNAALPAGAIDLFTLGGEQRASIKHVSTDPAHPKFLAPAPDSPHARVPAQPDSGLHPHIGAIPP